MTNDNAFHKQPTHPKLTDQESAAPLLIPKKIGPYKVEALLDKGGMSYLYLGTHPETKEPLTIKVLSQKYISHPEVVQRFLNEAEIISMTNHPNIVRMHGHGEWEGGLYIAMEYIEGTSLRKYILQNPLSLKRALGIIIDIAYALCHLHTHGVIHRDLKPENILLTEDGAIKVIDFGIAQLISEKVSSGTPTEQKLIGTPIYISPEQKENPERVSYPSDIYSLGIISYELILGKLSHGRIHLSLMPPGMQPILHKCLQPNPNKRYQDIVDFITDVSAYLNSPVLQKERKPGDRLSELSEELQNMQASLLPSSPPSWRQFEIGIASFKDFLGKGIYYDFFESSDETYRIISGEPLIRSAESVITAANFRGMVRALNRYADTPFELAKQLNNLLFQDNLGPVTNFNYLLFKPHDNVLDYISLGYGNLWHFSKKENLLTNCSLVSKPLGLAMGDNFESGSLSWEKGDFIFLNTISSLDLDETGEGRWDDKEFTRLLHDNMNLPPQQQVENILRRIKISAENFPEGQTLFLISVKRV